MKTRPYNKSFEYEIQSYDPYKKEYKMKNIITNEIKILSKKEFEELYKEQYTAATRVLKGSV